jgi:hypothetical protein
MHQKDQKSFLIILVGQNEDLPDKITITLTLNSSYQLNPVKLIQKMLCKTSHDVKIDS